mgnify:CR=1 FL=1
MIRMPDLSLVFGVWRGCWYALGVMIGHAPWQDRSCRFRMPARCVRGAVSIVGAVDEERGDVALLRAKATSWPPASSTLPAGSGRRREHDGRAARLALASRPGGRRPGDQLQPWSRGWPR